MKHVPETWIVAGLVLLAPLWSRAETTATPPAHMIDLSGSWQLALDPDNRGMAAGYATRALSSSVRLPGCLQEQGFGDKPGPDTLWWLGREKRKKVTPAFPFLARYHTAENFKLSAFSVRRVRSSGNPRPRPLPASCPFQWAEKYSPKPVLNQKPCFASRG